MYSLAGGMIYGPQILYRHIAKYADMSLQDLTRTML